MKKKKKEKRILNTCAKLFNPGGARIGPQARLFAESPTFNASIDSKQTPGTVARVPQMHHNCHVIWSSRVPRAHARPMNVRKYRSRVFSRISRAQEDRAAEANFFFFFFSFRGCRLYSSPGLTLSWCWGRSRRFHLSDATKFSKQRDRFCEIPAVYKTKRKRKGRNVRAPEVP